MAAERRQAHQQIWQQSVVRLISRYDSRASSGLSADMAAERRQAYQQIWQQSVVRLISRYGSRASSVGYGSRSSSVGYGRRSRPQKCYHSVVLVTGVASHRRRLGGSGRRQCVGCVAIHRERLLLLGQTGGWSSDVIRLNQDVIGPNLDVAVSQFAVLHGQRRRPAARCKRVGGEKAPPADGRWQSELRQSSGDFRVHTRRVSVIFLTTSRNAARFMGV